MSKTALRAMAAGTGVAGFHVAANFMLPDYFAVTKFTGYIAAGTAGVTASNTSSLAPLVMMVLPSMIGGVGFVTAPMVSKMLPQSIKDKLKIKIGRGCSPAAGGQEGSGTVAVAGDAPAAAAATTDQAAAAAAPAAQAGPSPEEMAAMVEQAVGKKVEEATADVKGLKAEFATFQSDIVKIKQDVQNLTASLETSLTDLKAFQAEMVNPLNFMRTYFEALDIKSLSDPTQTLPNIEIKAPAGVEQVSLAPKSEEPRPAAAEQKQKRPVYSHEDNDKVTHGEKNISERSDGDDDDDDDASTPTGEPSAQPALEGAFGRLLAAGAGGKEAEQTRAAGKGRDGSKEDDKEKMTTAAAAAGGDSQDGSSKSGHGKVSLGKLMSMVSVLDKIVQDIGPDNIETLIEHYRQFGLSTEDEMAIYNIVSMMKDFNMGPDDIVVKLYKLGQVMGIKDPQADLEYAKIMARIKSRQKSTPSPSLPRQAGAGTGTTLYRKDDMQSGGGIAYG